MADKKAATPRESKIYYVASDGLTIHWKMEKKAVVDGALHILEAPRYIEFINGTYSTTDPDEQDYLDKYVGCVPFEKWEETHVSPEIRREKTARENASMKGALADKDEQLAELRKQLAEK